jgi:hypothetical protein
MVNHITRDTADGKGGNKAPRSFGGGGDVKIGQSLHIFLLHGADFGFQEVWFSVRRVVASRISVRLAMDGGFEVISMVQ